MGSVALVADDHEMSRVALAGVLTGRLGFDRVLETSSFDEALDVLSEHDAVSLAVFDLHMPGMAGPGTLAAVREVFPGVRVVVVTGSTRREDVLAALSAGVHGYVPKTLRLDEIARALGSIVDGALYVPPSLADLPSRADAEPAPAVTPASSAPLDGLHLTARQSETLRLLQEGRSNKEIARLLNLRSGTVKVHVSSVLRALNAPSRAAAVAAAARLQGASGTR